MDKQQVIVPFDSGNATIIPTDGADFKIVITSNGIKYEFFATPAGIDAFSIDGGQVKTYSK